MHIVFVRPPLIRNGGGVALHGGPSSPFCAQAHTKPNPQCGGRGGCAKRTHAWAPMGANEHPPPHPGAPHNVGAPRTSGIAEGDPPASAAGKGLRGAPSRHSPPYLWAHGWGSALRAPSREMGRKAHTEGGHIPISCCYVHPPHSSTSGSIKGIKLARGRPPPIPSTGLEGPFWAHLLPRRGTQAPHLIGPPLRVAAARGLKCPPKGAEDGRPAMRGNKKTSMGSWPCPPFPPTLWGVGGWTRPFADINN